MFCGAQCHSFFSTRAGHSRFFPHVGYVYPSVIVEPWLLLSYQWKGLMYRLIGCNDWSHQQWRSCCEEANPRKQDLLQRSSGVQWPTPWVVCFLSLLCLLLCCLRLSTGALALEPPRRCRPGSAVACAMPEASRHELQNDLHMASTCAGLGGAQERPSCQGQGQLPLVPYLRPLSKRYEVCRGHMLLVWSLGPFKRF